MKTKFKNNFTTREQSEKLLGLGIPADSADCFFYLNTNYSDKPHILYKKLSETQADYDSPVSSIIAILYPCWSVGRLIEIWLLCNNAQFSVPLTFCIDRQTKNIISLLIKMLEKQKNDGAKFSELI